MGILTEDIQAVRDQTDIVALVGSYVQLKKEGQQFVGLCPFHAERSGSFKVHPQKQLVHCHGCKAGGDAIWFVQEIEHLDFRDAVEMLASKSGTQLRFDDTATSESAEKRKRLFDLVAAAVEFYNGLLLDVDNPEARQARMYLKSRGYGGDVARQFGLGWAPDRSEDGSKVAYDRLTKHLKASPREMEAAGLGFAHERFGVSDSFRGRIMFPIHDVQGRPVAFGGRILPGTDGPKYKNSSEGPLYAKSRTLYGLSWAKQAIVRSDEVVVVEGYTDVVGLHLAGIETAVATCGTALTEDHVRLLRRHAERIVLAFDADAAGGAGMERMHQWEREHGVEACVAILPAGSDPAELAANDPDRMRSMIADAVPLMRFRVDRAIESCDTSTPEGKAKAVDAAMDVVRSHPDPVVRDEYLVSTAAVLGLDVGMLRARERRAPAVVQEAVRSAEEGDGPERAPEGAPLAAIRVAVHRPTEIAAWLERGMFPDGTLREAFDALAGGGSDSEVLDRASDRARSLLTEILVADDDQEDALVVAADLAAAGLRRGLLRASEMRRVEGTDLPALLSEIALLSGWLDSIQADVPNAQVLADVVDWIAGGGLVLGVSSLS